VLGKSQQENILQYQPEKRIRDNFKLHQCMVKHVASDYVSRFANVCC